MKNHPAINNPKLDSQNAPATN